jgi:hypothetical protein
VQTLVDRFGRQITSRLVFQATDRQIDGLVHELDGLTDDEIKITEEAAQP